jgi:hypothetical protein
LDAGNGHQPSADAFSGWPQRAVVSPAASGEQTRLGLRCRPAGPLAGAKAIMTDKSSAESIVDALRPAEIQTVVLHPRANRAIVVPSASPA